MPVLRMLAADDIVEDLLECADAPAGGHTWYVVRNYNPARIDEWRDYLGDASDAAPNLLEWREFTGITVYELALP